MSPTSQIGMEVFIKFSKNKVFAVLAIEVDVSRILFELRL